MARKRFHAEQIIFKLREAEVLLAKVTCHPALKQKGSHACDSGTWLYLNTLPSYFQKPNTPPAFSIKELGFDN